MDSSTLQLISLILSFLATFGIGTVFTTLWKEKHDQRKQNSDQAKERDKQERIKQMTEIVSNQLNPIKYDLNMIHQQQEQFIELVKENINESVQPIQQDIQNLHCADSQQKDGLQAILQELLYQLARECFKKGYKTLEEGINFKHMYNSYHTLGANGVMDNVKEKFDALPFESEVVDIKYENTED